MFEFSKWICLTSIVSLVVMESMGQRQYREVPNEEKRIFEGAEDRQGEKRIKKDWGVGSFCRYFDVRFTFRSCINNLR